MGKKKKRQRKKAEKRAQLQGAKCVVEKQGRVLLVRVKSKKRREFRGGMSMPIRDFTPKARLNMLREVNRLDLDDESVKDATFVTLTYPPEHAPAVKDSKVHLDKFVKKLKRRNEGVGGYWKLEAQQNGSPHYHLALFGCKDREKSSIEKQWASSIVKPRDRYLLNRRPVVDVQQAKSAKDVLMYLAKGVSGGRAHTLVYINNIFTSLPDDDVFHFSDYELRGARKALAKAEELRDLARSQGRLLSDEDLGRIIFKYLPITLQNKIAPETGRFWGKIGRDHIPYAEKSVSVVDYDEKVHSDLNRVARRAGKTKNDSLDNGLTIFADDVDSWERLACGGFA